MKIEADVNTHETKLISRVDNAIPNHKINFYPPYNICFENSFAKKSIHSSPRWDGSQVYYLLNTMQF